MHPLTFSLDEWDFLVDRRGWTIDSFLNPHNEHISVIPVGIYKVLVTAFGMTSQAPFQVALTICTVACALLVWTYVRRRLGDWLALAAILPLLFLGSGGVNLIWPFQLTLMTSLADPQAQPVPGVTVGPYLDAIAEYGSPAYSENEIIASDDLSRGSSTESSAASRAS